MTDTVEDPKSTLLCRTIRLSASGVFRRPSADRNDKIVTTAAIRFMAHLVNQKAPLHRLHVHIHWALSERVSAGVRCMTSDRPAHIHDKRLDIAPGKYPKAIQIPKRFGNLVFSTAVDFDERDC